MGERTAFTLRQAAIYIGLAVLVAALAAALVLTAELFLLIFGAIILAVFIRSLSDFLAEKTRLHPQVSVALVVLFLMGLAVLSGFLLMPQILDQFEDLVDRIPDTFNQLESYLLRVPGGRFLLGEVRNLGGENGSLTGIIEALSFSLRGLLNIVVVSITGLYLAAQPGLYTRGVLRLFPIPWRGRVGEIISELGSTLRWFLLGRVVSMIAVGLATWGGLALIGVPAAVLLGLVAGAFTFVPYAGPIAASIPIGLAALLEGPTVLIYALIFYTGVQSLEGFFITPLVQERVVTLPPALTLGAEVFMGLLFGALGVILSVPAAAIGVTLVRLVYVEQVLQDHDGAETGK
jgi:predicted PurR-regulated permease PerM